MSNQGRAMATPPGGTHFHTKGFGRRGGRTSPLSLSLRPMDEAGEKRACGENALSSASSALASYARMAHIPAIESLEWPSRETYVVGG